MATITALGATLVESLGCLTSVTASPGELTVTPGGAVVTPQGSFSLAGQGRDALARFAGVPATLAGLLDPEELAFVLNRRLASPRGWPPILRAVIDKRGRVVAVNDGRLAVLRVEDVIAAIEATLPARIPADRMHVDPGATSVGTTSAEIALQTHALVTEPRPGDVINGGVLVSFSLGGEHATRVRCFIRRLVCANGMIAHVCLDRRRARTRTLRAGKEVMLARLRRVLAAAWEQVQEKLDALPRLLELPAAGVELLMTHRARWGLNNAVIDEVAAAMEQDELPRTGSMYDMVNALARVATHRRGMLTERQRLTLAQVAGEMGLAHYRRCEACGSFLDSHPSPRRRGRSRRGRRVAQGGAR